VAVSDPVIKREIRLAAEEEERRSYSERMPSEWLAALAPLGTSPDKAFLEVVPWLVAVFAQSWGQGADGERRKHYYVTESVGMACGLFAAAVHAMGLSTVTHTPSPMAFLGEILGRPDNERAYVLFPVGYAGPDCHVPELHRKSLDEVAVFVTPR
jgi:nitroreductase